MWSSLFRQFVPHQPGRLNVEALEDRIVLSHGGPEVISGQFLVTLKSDVDAQEFAREVRGLGREVMHVYSHALNGLAVRGQALADDPRIAAIEPDHVHHITAQELPTGIDRIEVDKNPNTSGAAVDIDIAIIDTGIDVDHPDLNVASSVSFAGGSGNDSHGHGTHVAGTAGAIDNDIGVKGVAPGARVHAIKVCKPNGSCPTSAMVAGIDYAASKKSDFKNDVSGGIDFAVANMSISTPDDASPCSGSSGAIHQAICGLVNKGVVLTLSAGNNSRVKNAFPEVLAVSATADFDGLGGGQGSATCRSDVDDTLANFSNYGSEVDIAAPGTCITSTWKNGGISTISGTSMASPHVAGAVALYLETNNMSPATDAAGVDAIESAIISAALPEGTANHLCSYDNERGSSEPFLFVNGAAFGGDGMCDSGSTIPNNPPVADDLSENTDEDSPDNWIPVVSDADFDPLTCSSDASSANGGTVTVNSDCSSGTYTPAANFSGSDTFSYSVSDGLAMDTAIVTYTVSPINDAPTANDVIGSTPINTPGLWTPDVSDVDGDTLTCSANATSNRGGTVTVNSDCSGGTYDPPTNETGIDTFSYMVSDVLLSDSAMVTVTITDPGSTTDMHVGDLDGVPASGSGPAWGVVITSTVHDNNEGAVEGATVNLSWSGSKGYAGGSDSCLTDSNGQCSVSTGDVIPKNNASVTFTVDSVTDTLTYDQAANHDPDGDSNGTSITVAKGLIVTGDAVDQTAFGDALTDAMLASVAEEAIGLWADVGLDAGQLFALFELDLRIAELEGSLLGWAAPGIFVIDRDAAGFGWTTDAPTAESPITDAVDLLSAVMHEFGHALGFDHDSMGDSLDVAVRDLHYLDDIRGQLGFSTHTQQPGDANRDGQFDQRDLIAILQNGKYLTGEAADWTEGDWNGDGVFDQLDLVAALQTGRYFKEP